MTSMFNKENLEIIYHNALIIPWAGDGVLRKSEN